MWSLNALRASLGSATTWFCGDGEGLYRELAKIDKQEALRLLAKSYAMVSAGGPPSRSGTR
jgi:hypothetical protein